MFKNVKELREMSLEELVELRQKVLDHFWAMRDLYYESGDMKYVEGEYELELYFNRIEHVLFAAPLKKDNL